MLPHQERVIAEKHELDVKRDALNVFIGGTVFAGLDEAEKERLMRQAEAMREYSLVIGERIDAF